MDPQCLASGICNEPYSQRPDFSSDIAHDKHLHEVYIHAPLRRSISPSNRIIQITIRTSVALIALSFARTVIPGRMPPIKKVVVLGAGGNVGKSTIKALLAEPGRFEVTGVTREDSDAVLPAVVRHVRSDYSKHSLQDAFAGQDAIVSTISPFGLDDQSAIVDAAIAAGVQVILPSEYGVDTAVPAATDVIPFLKAKVAAVEYLRSKEDQISWVAVITGSIFDWGLNIPGFGGWNLPARSVTIYDGGDVEYEATTLDQVGRAITATLKHPKLTKNKNVYVNSFTVTQNGVLSALEKATNHKFAVSHNSSDDLWQDGVNKVKEGQQLGVLAQVASAFYQKGAKLGLGNYSRSRGLWNDRLDLASEDLESFIQAFVDSKSGAE